MADSFGSYNTAMDKAYMVDYDTNEVANVEEPLFPISKVGQSVTEGARFGTLINTVQGAIRMGAGSIELQTGFGGGAEAVGAEAYGKDAREALRELARANQVTLTSVHTPTQVGNLSGLTQQGFQEDQRHMFVDEVKKAIKFAAETTQGGAVVVHTGEFQRTMFDADWNKEGKWKDSFFSYDEEPERSTVTLVDQKSGRLIQEIRRNQVIHQAVWNKTNDNYEYAAGELDVKRGMASRIGQTIHVEANDYVDYEGKKLTPEDRIAKWDKEKKEFIVKATNWQDFEREAAEMNKRFGYKKGDDNFITPEEAAIKAQMQGQIAIARGYKLNYGGRVEDEIQALDKLKDQLKHYKNIEAEIPKDELWKLKREAQDITGRYVSQEFLPPHEHKLPSEILKDAIDKVRQQVDSAREMVLGQEQQIRKQTEDMKNIVSVSKYAIKNSVKSYVDAGLYAMEQTQNNPYAERDIFVAPENIFPEMGYGSHPDELIELVEKSRDAMTKRLVNPYQDNPTGKIIETENEARELNSKWGTKLKVGDNEVIDNPWYREGISQNKAKDIAKRHLKATVDTQHLGMWWKHFRPKGVTSDSERREMFKDWYIDQIKNLEKHDIIGNIHLVDSVGGGHHHLPMGQGDLPLTDALTYLKKHGYSGSINSEAHGEAAFGADRILVETWKSLGSPIYSHGASGSALSAPRQWGDVSNSYFGKMYPPNFVFGAYAPSNEWSLWSEVPME